MPGCAFKFIHCADLHLGSSCSGFAGAVGTLAAELADAAFAALDRIVKLAVTEKVCFVTVAGDIFEDVSPSLLVRSRFLSAVSVLRDAGIKVFIVCGNHDPAAAGIFDALLLPDNVTVFPADNGTFVPVKRGDGTVLFIGGISYRDAAETSDLSRRITAAIPEVNALKLALLHTSLAANAPGDRYAPADINTLKTAGINCWLLGHVHSYTKLNDLPLILYSGTPQGRHINETGSHGCVLITVSEDDRFTPEFIPVSPWEFARIDTDISGCTRLDEVFERIRKTVPETAVSDGKLLCRLSLTGATVLDNTLRSEDETSLLQLLTAALPPQIIVESLRLRTRPQVAVNPVVAEEINSILAKFKAENNAAVLLQRLRKFHPAIREYSDVELAAMCDRAGAMVVDALSAGGES